MASGTELSLANFSQYYSSYKSLYDESRFDGSMDPNRTKAYRKCKEEGRALLSETSSLLSQEKRAAISKVLENIKTLRHSEKKQSKCEGLRLGILQVKRENEHRYLELVNRWPSLYTALTLKHRDAISMMSAMNKRESNGTLKFSRDDRKIIDKFNELIKRLGAQGLAFNQQLKENFEGLDCNECLVKLCQIREKLGRGQTISKADKQFDEILFTFNSQQANFDKFIKSQEAIVNRFERSVIRFQKLLDEKGYL
ncbi:MAG: hypothetical protein K2P51_01400 [Rhabdochlamydiaceae bacterium]|nr:hypothetical protein [Rhabdochlamydiaceae bacterium]